MKENETKIVTTRNPHFAALNTLFTGNYSHNGLKIVISVNKLIAKLHLLAIRKRVGRIGTLEKSRVLSFQKARRAVGT